MEDTKIVDLYLARDESAVAETASKYGLRLRGIARRLLDSEPAAEECENDTYLEAWNRIPPDEPDPFSHYLGRLTRWLSLSRLRDQNRLRRGGGEPTLALEELEGTLAAPSDAESVVEYRELTAAIDRFLAKLPETERRVFLCRYWHFAGVAEIAAQFGFTRSKVKSMLLRCRRKLKQQLLEEGYL